MASKNKTGKHGPEGEGHVREGRCEAEMCHWGRREVADDEWRQLQDILSQCATCTVESLTAKGGEGPREEMAGRKGCWAKGEIPVRRKKYVRRHPSGEEATFRLGKLWNFVARLTELCHRGHSEEGEKALRAKIRRAAGARQREGPDALQLANARREEEEKRATSKRIAACRRSMNDFARAAKAIRGGAAAPPLGIVDERCGRRAASSRQRHAGTPRGLLGRRLGARAAELRDGLCKDGEGDPQRRRGGLGTSGGRGPRAGGGAPPSLVGRRRWMDRRRSRTFAAGRLGRGPDIAQGSPGEGRRSKRMCCRQVFLP